uniref:Putative cytochrome n=1 Tax=Rhipicephalus microplus TaxID=6941 RepID=A0A6G4ZV47_RHIMP
MKPSSHFRITCRWRSAPVFAHTDRKIFGSQHSDSKLNLHWNLCLLSAHKLDVMEGVNQTQLHRLQCQAHPDTKPEPTITTKRLTEIEAMAQCVLFFLAGLETTSSTLAFATYHLALNPKVQEKLRKEVDECMAAHVSCLSAGDEQNIITTKKKCGNSQIYSRYGSVDFPSDLTSTSLLPSLLSS